MSDEDEKGLTRKKLRLTKEQSAFLEDNFKEPVIQGERERECVCVKDLIQGALFPEIGVENGIGQAGGAGGLVLVRDLDLFSYCEYCLLPFQITRADYGFMGQIKKFKNGVDVVVIAVF
ncbi:hypothetical protein L1887_32401 [Cichorium endivia]|nr:hypothetical protein L1887_32401 [Cichorium endivia]